MPAVDQRAFVYADKAERREHLIVILQRARGNETALIGKV